MSLQPLFMKLIHLLNHIYSDRICHIPSISRALLLNNVFQWVCVKTRGLAKVLNEPYLSPIMTGILQKRRQRCLYSWKVFAEMKQQASCHPSPLQTASVICSVFTACGLTLNAIRRIALISVALITPPTDSLPPKWVCVSSFSTLQSDTWS